MAARVFILFAGHAKWQFCAADSATPEFVDIDITAGSNPEEITVEVADALKHAGYDGEGVLLAIPSAWCLCAPITTSGLPARNRHQAMAYRLEEKLPLAAEDVIADFVPFGPADAETFGVAVQKKTIIPLVSALESAGVAVSMICPVALLALQQMRMVEPALNSSVESVVLPGAGGDALDLFLLRAGNVRGWHALSNQPRELLLHLSVEFRDAESGSHPIAVGDVSAEIRRAILSKSNLRIVDDVQLPATCIAATALGRLVLAGKVIPWINLRRDSLAVGDPFRQIKVPLTFAAVAILIFLLCLCGGMLWRANRYDQLADRHADEQQVVFHQAFSKEIAPADVLSRLAAEERRLRGLSGDASAPAQQQSGLVVLRDLITHLPAGDQLRYRVLELRLDQTHFTLEGQTGAHGDADLIATSLRKGGEFTVDPPRTEQLGGADSGDAAASAEKGVAFTITGAVGVWVDRRPAP